MREELEKERREQQDSLKSYSDNVSKVSKELKTMNDNLEELETQLAGELSRRPNAFARKTDREILGRPGTANHFKTGRSGKNRLAADRRIPTLKRK